MSKQVLRKPQAKNASPFPTKAQPCRHPSPQPHPSPAPAKSAGQDWLPPSPAIVLGSRGIWHSRPNPMGTLWWSFSSLYPQHLYPHEPREMIIRDSLGVNQAIKHLSLKKVNLNLKNINLPFCSQKDTLQLKDRIMK